MAVGFGNIRDTLSAVGFERSSANVGGGRYTAPAAQSAPAPAPVQLVAATSTGGETGVLPFVAHLIQFSKWNPETEDPVALSNGELAQAAYGSLKDPEMVQKVADIVTKSLVLLHEKAKECKDEFLKFSPDFNTTQTDLERMQIMIKVWKDCQKNLEALSGIVQVREQQRGFFTNLLSSPKGHANLSAAIDRIKTDAFFVISLTYENHVTKTLNVITEIQIGYQGKKPKNSIYQLFDKSLSSDVESTIAKEVFVFSIMENITSQSRPEDFLRRSDNRVADRTVHTESSVALGLDLSEHLKALSAAFDYEADLSRLIGQIVNEVKPRFFIHPATVKMEKIQRAIEAQSPLIKRTHPYLLDEGNTSALGL